MIAILIPCYNEELTVGGVVEGFRAQLPSARIFVYDNNSTDATTEVARRAGAEVRFERRQGKGYVVQSMFRQIDADVYVMVDGDGTYPPEAVHDLVAPILSGEADQVVGSRLHALSHSEFRSVNRWGNRLVRATLNSVFRVRVTDVLSGYRAFSRPFVKSLPLFGGGFEIETELTIKAAERGYRIVEVPVNLTSRPEGSHSKIQVFRDGLIILNTILSLLRDYKPLTFFGVAGLAAFVAALASVVVSAALLPFAWHAARLACAILAACLFMCGLLSVAVGLVLHTLARRSQEFEHHVRVLLDEMRARRGDDVNAVADD
jgi:glycosyltransferase involved in cell wall biosynthesis